MRHSAVLRYHWFPCISAYSNVGTHQLKPHEPVDRNAIALNVGDLVRIVGVPDLSGMPKECLAETLTVFAHLVGKNKRIVGFDDRGCAEISFVIRPPKKGHGWHSVWIEPYLLQLPRRRAT
jgi:hypothetical protein